MCLQNVCVCMFVCICPRECVSVSVGGRNICLLAASFPLVPSDGDKGVACGYKDRRMLCLFRRGPQAATSQHEEEGVWKKGGGIRQRRVMIKTTKGSDRKRSRRVDY